VKCIPVVISQNTWVVPNSCMFKAEVVIRDLLGRLAPTLKQLCFDQSLSSTVFYAPVPLPALVELVCCFRGPWNDQDAWIDTRPFYLNTMLPVLRRLHYIVGRMDQGLFRLNVTHALPSTLDLVRFSNAHMPLHLLSILSRPKKSPWALQKVLKIIISHKPALAPLFYTPVMQGDDAEDISLPEEVQAEPNDLEEWRRVASANKRITEKLFVVQDIDEYNGPRLYREWLARVQGQEKC
jgi:hypothetical protein